MNSENENTDYPKSLKLVCDPLSRTTLALYCGASGDHHPLHVDTDWVKAHTDLPDVIGHGMLSMAYLGRVLTNQFAPEQIQSLDARFLAPTNIGDIITCTAERTAAGPINNSGNISYRVRATTQDDKTIADGSAVIRPRQD